MTGKKSYTFRIDTNLLETLRRKADAEKETVTTVIHNILYEYLQNQDPVNSALSQPALNEARLAIKEILEHEVEICLSEMKEEFIKGLNEGRFEIEEMLRNEVENCLSGVREMLVEDLKDKLLN